MLRRERKKNTAKPENGITRADTPESAEPGDELRRELQNGPGEGKPLSGKEFEKALARLGPGPSADETGSGRLASPIGYTRKHGGLPAAKKSLGQNWLEDPGAAARIASLAVSGADKQVLEVGPGGGALTEALLAEGADVTSVEIDKRMVDLLKRRFGDNSRLRVLHDDILKANFAEIMGGGEFSLTGNLPFHITSSLLFRVLEYAGEHPGMLRRIVVMMQLEVARRIAAPPGHSEYGILSVFTRLWGEPVLEFIVPRTSFRPQPKVDAGVLVLDLAESPRWTLSSWPTFKRLVKGTFRHRRKMLRNSLPSISGLGPWQDLDFDWSRRPQTLSAGEFAHLAEQLIPADEHKRNGSNGS